MVLIFLGITLIVDYDLRLMLEKKFLHVFLNEIPKMHLRPYRDKSCINVLYLKPIPNLESRWGLHVY